MPSELQAAPSIVMPGNSESEDLLLGEEEAVGGEKEVKKLPVIN